MKIALLQREKGKLTLVMVARNDAKWVVFEAKSRKKRHSAYF